MSEPQPLTAVGGKSAHSVMALHDAAEPKSKSNPSVSDMAKVASQPVEGVVGFPIWKRTFDAVLIFLAAPLWLPVCLVVAVVIRLGSRGPLLFKQDRVGQGGKIFTCFKFRTMKLNADQGAHQNHVKDLIKSSAPMVKLDAADDERLTRGGSWIRAMGLDELPQLINVLRGDMSIVGPRPCIPYEYELYEPWQKQRFNAPPGLTGLWQVSGKNRTTFDEMVRLDMAYARRMSVWLDLKIIVLTPVTIVQQVADTWLAKKQMWSKKSSK
jgi:lipopolysaccharide/colanic/teichoic acid biosynthesis glycosyltransferase